MKTKTSAKAKMCANEGCDKRAVAKGFCNSHYMRLLRGSDPYAPTQRRLDAGESLPVPRVSIEVYYALRQQAQAEGVPMYRLLRQIIDDWYESRLRKNAKA
jgi:hypothetical protein